MYRGKGSPSPYLGKGSVRERRAAIPSYTDRVCCVWAGNTGWN